MTKQDLHKQLDLLPDSFQGILIPSSNELIKDRYLDIVRAELVRFHIVLHGTRERACQMIGVSSRQERAWCRTLTFGLPLVGVTNDVDASPKCG